MALPHLVGVLFLFNGPQGHPRLMPPILGLDGDLFLYLILIIVIVVLTVMVIRFLNQSIELALQIEKEMKFSQELEEMVEELTREVDNQKQKIKTLEEKLRAYEVYVQELEQQVSTDQSYSPAQTSMEAREDVEAYQHYEDLGTEVEGSHYAEVPPPEEVVEKEEEEVVEKEKPKKKRAPVIGKAKVISIPTLSEWSTQQDFIIQDVFVIYRDGRLMTHLSKKIRIIDDSEIIGSMIAAVQMAVRESFKRESKGTLDALRFSDLTVLMETGAFLNLAVVIRGRNYNKLKGIMMEVVSNIHKAWGDDIEDWDGQKTNVKVIERVVQKDLLDRFETETFHSAESKTMDLSQAKVFKPE